MRLIIETDIGHDPDDFFAITYLIAAGVDVAAILITPGDPDQIAIVRLLLDECGLAHVPIGVSKPGQTKLSSGSIHHALLKRYGRPLTAEANGVGHEVCADAMRPGTELFVIGPVSNVGGYLERTHTPFARATMQGGFCPYAVYQPAMTVPSMVGKSSMPTFNLNGDRKAAARFLGERMPRQMVGKNVCHSVLFDRARFGQHWLLTSRASELFVEAGRLYLETHESKKFHDPTAAVCHLHPEVGTWYDGSTVKAGDGWTTVSGHDKVLVDLDHEAMWGYLSTFS